MNKLHCPYWFRGVAATVVIAIGGGASIGGCSAMPNAADSDGLNLAEPSPSFMKKVEKDPFPRAGEARRS